MFEVNDITQIITALKAIMGNPWILTFLSLFILGYYLKEHTSLNNKLIPTVIFVAGGVLGFGVIDKSFAGVILGFIMAYIIIAFYEHIKNTIEYIVMKKKAPTA